MRTSSSVASRLRRWRPVLYLAVLAVVLHAMLPFVHAASPVAGSAWGSICSVAGASVLPTAPPDAPANGLLPKCPLCLSGAHLALAVPAGLFADFDPAAAHEQPVVLPAARADMLAAHFFLARAPPSLT